MPRSNILPRPKLPEHWTPSNPAQSPALPKSRHDTPHEHALKVLAVRCADDDTQPSSDESWSSDEERFGELLHDAGMRRNMMFSPYDVRMDTGEGPSTRPTVPLPPSPLPSRELRAARPGRGARGKAAAAHGSISKGAELSPEEAEEATRREQALLDEVQMQIRRAYEEDVARKVKCQAADEEERLAMEALFMDEDSTCADEDDEDDFSKGDEDDDGEGLSKDGHAHNGA